MRGLIHPFRRPATALIALGLAGPVSPALADQFKETADGGTIEVDGKVVAIDGPKAAERLGIGSADLEHYGRYKAKVSLDLFERLKARNREGVVIKRSDEMYTAGRPNSGGPRLKFKFVDTASFIVIKVNGKRSVSLMVFDGDKVVPVGNVTIPPNHEIPGIGAVG